MIKAFVRLREVRRILKGKQENIHQRAPEQFSLKAQKRKPLSFPSTKTPSKIVAIGISTGGPVALARFLPEIPGNMGVPLLIAQHMPPVFTESLARNLDQRCAITVKEAADGEKIEPNTAYIAPGGKQMKVADDVFKKEKSFELPMIHRKMAANHRPITCSGRWPNISAATPQGLS
jgi:two-component system chemotaxis response regulator CheB